MTLNIFWQFWYVVELFDSFNTMIHNNTDLSTVKEFQYLKDCVIEDAEIIIAPLLTTSENYKVA